MGLILPLLGEELEVGGTMAKQLHRESGGKGVATKLGDAAILLCLD